MDVLVEMGRDLAASMHKHPERYLVVIQGALVLMIDDAGYDALFYLYSGHTREHAKELKGPAILFMGMYPIMSPAIMEEMS